MGADAARAGFQICRQKSVNDYIRETHTRSNLVPRPLPDFITQPRKKISMVARYNLGVAWGRGYTSRAKAGLRRTPNRLVLRLSLQSENESNDPLKSGPALAGPAGPATPPLSPQGHIEQQLNPPMITHYSNRQHFLYLRQTTSQHFHKWH